MARLTWSEPALADLERAAAYIARESPRAAADFTRRVLAATRRLAAFPASGRIVPEYSRTDIREVIVHPYRVMYSLIGDQVEVVTVIHGARDVLRGEFPWNP